jgi:hypothetical protein
VCMDWLVGMWVCICGCVFCLCLCVCVYKPVFRVCVLVCQVVVVVLTRLFVAHFLCCVCRCTLGVCLRSPSIRSKDKSDRATQEQVLDPRTRMILFRLLDRDYINQIHGCVSTGKEANVYHADLGAGSGELDHLEAAIKIYKTSILVFKDRERYITGEWRWVVPYSRMRPTVCSVAVFSPQPLTFSLTTPSRLRPPSSPSPHRSPHRSPSPSPHRVSFFTACLCACWWCPHAD